MAKDRKTRGRTSITGPSMGASPTRPNLKQERVTEVSRPQGAGSGGKPRGDRRDMNKAYTGNAKHAARGNSPRANVSTRKN